ncbi:MAG: ABC transporter permease subunit [Eubacterium sp.]|nr:ABC transporter permease subunit [Eubacterium sp.]MCM1213685.1 ABC transporter permease subunit [Lachnospiraceae bacterium]MCM1302818.1 ABC transporter permease subunit [Butyrivibrio sp.]MCM1344218.1 ABC transporter permease subunit [Muribaculaceae bacterium]MCM1237806.1 ABC transporter permease subunit [Lachnospiraceae bacterium]
MGKDKVSAPAKVNQKSNWARTWKIIRKNKAVYFMLLPVVLYYVLFHYKPMYGVIIAFMDYNPRRGIDFSDWVGLRHFKDFFTGYYFGRLLGNTLKLSFATLLIGFPIPVILALLINELRSKKFSKIVQSITYMPHFVSMVVLCAMVRQFVGGNGFITAFMSLFGYEGGNLLANGKYWIPIYVISNIWQGAGWGSIVYLAALTSIDSQLYDAAKVDGANRWKQTIHVTIPSILPTIIIMLIMRVGQIMGIGYEKTLLLYNEGIYDVADIISTYVYRMGLLNRQFSFSTAVGLFNSVVNFALVIIANQISKKTTETSLW